MILASLSFFDMFIKIPIAKLFPIPVTLSTSVEIVCVIRIAPVQLSMNKCYDNQSLISIKIIMMKTMPINITRVSISFFFSPWNDEIHSLSFISA